MSKESHFTGQQLMEINMGYENHTGRLKAYLILKAEGKSDEEIMRIMHLSKDASLRTMRFRVAHQKL